MSTIRERPFTNEVIREARAQNWEVFHIHDQDSVENYRKLATGAGFPDLILYRTEEQGASMIAAELKVDADYSVVRPNQEAWLSAFEQFMPTFVWRPSDWDAIEKVLREGPPTKENAAQTTTARATETIPPNVLPPNLPAIVGRLRQTIREQEFPSGDLASLRRMEITSPSLVFRRLAAERRLAGIGGTDSDEKWACLLQGMALLAEQDHGRVVRIGRALFSGGDAGRREPFYSERRFDQLLQARGAMLRTLLRRCFRMLVGTDQSLYWVQVAEFVLNDGFNETAAESVRRDIAQDYYAARAIANRESQSQQEEA